LSHRLLSRTILRAIENDRIFFHDAAVPFEDAELALVLNEFIDESAPIMENDLNALALAGGCVAAHGYARFIWISDNWNRPKCRELLVSSPTPCLTWRLALSAARLDPLLNRIRLSQAGLVTEPDVLAQTQMNMLVFPLHEPSSSALTLGV
jgi:hypothetical protein